MKRSLAAIFGRRLRTLRKTRGWTQEELGRAARVDYKHIGGIELGKHTPSFEAVERLAKALGVEYGELFTSARTATGQIQDDLEAVARDIECMDKVAMRQFILDLRNAVRRLESTLK